MGGDGPVVEPQDLPGEAQPDARTALLGCEERDEYFVKDFRKNACSVVCDLHGNPSPFIEKCFQLDDRLFMSVKGMDRVPDQVYNHLFDQLLIG